ncbi:MAG: 50S ribosomal protein L13 [Thaumarchaeota archaeon]|nr:50S ribosomal protein L13 [Nitrososphaerota archaeon]
MAKQEQVSAGQAQERDVVVDGTNQIAGRLCSHVAKLLINGSRVSIVNSENIMLSGSRDLVIREYREFLEIASITNPKFGPFHPRRPDTMITKMVRGMLPKNKPSGQTSLKRLRTYLGVPNELRSKKKIQFDDAKIRKPAPYYVTLGDLGRTVGWHE